MKPGSFVCSYRRCFAIDHGFCKGRISRRLCSTSVIKGMLSAIGIILILKQIPHLVGYDADFEGDETFLQHDSENTFSGILAASPSLLHWQ